MFSLPLIYLLYMTKEEFQLLVKSVPNRHNLILKLGMKETGTGRRFINKLFVQYPDTDTSHFHIVHHRNSVVEKTCPKCENTHVKKGKFCGRSCANGRVHTVETKRKISGGVKTSDCWKAAVERSRTGKMSIPYKPKPKVGVGLRTIKIKKRVNIRCMNCNKEFEVIPFQVGKRKFCNGSCRNIFNNKLMQGHRSKAEILLEERLRDNFPSVNILFNDRKILNGLELDVFVPSLKFAIEWNGIFHIKNIRGNLDKVQKKDKIKLLKCNELGVELFVIEDLTSNPKFVEVKIEEIINILKDKIYRAEVRATNEKSKSSELSSILSGSASLAKWKIQ